MVFIFGTGDVSQLVEFYLRRDTRYHTMGFVVDEGYRTADVVNGRRVFTLPEVVQRHPPDRGMAPYFIVPLYDNRLRAKKAAEVKALGYPLTSYRSSKATIWGEVGENCVVMEGNVIQPFATVGNNVILWSGNHIGHHSVVKDNCFFSSHVVLSGHCTVEPYCWLGVNSTVRDHVTLAEGTLVGMAAAVTKDTAPWKKYVGVPAKEAGDVG